MAVAFFVGPERLGLWIGSAAVPPVALVITGAVVVGVVLGVLWIAAKLVGRG
jgi:hypothetical protein